MTEAAVALALTLAVLAGLVAHDRRRWLRERDRRFLHLRARHYGRRPVTTVTVAALLDQLEGKTHEGR